MAIIQEISEYLQKGRAKNVKALVEQALNEGVDAKDILNDGLLSGMMIIGEKFKNNERRYHGVGTQAGRDRKRAGGPGCNRHRKGRPS